MLSETERKLEIELNHRMLGAVVSLYDLYGIDPRGRPIEVLVSKMFQMLIEGLFQDGAIEELSEEQLQEKLAPFFEDIQTLKETQDEDLSEIEQKLASEQAPPSPGAPDLQNFPEDLFSEKEEEETPIEFSSLSPSDPLVEYCEGDEAKQKALCRVYARIPKEKRGSDRAAQMLAVELGENPHAD